MPIFGKRVKGKIVRLGRNVNGVRFRKKRCAVVPKILVGFPIGKDGTGHSRRNAGFFDLQRNGGSAFVRILEHSRTRTTLVLSLSVTMVALSVFPIPLGIVHK